MKKAPAVTIVNMLGHCLLGNMQSSVRLVIGNGKLHASMILSMSCWWLESNSSPGLMIGLKSSNWALQLKALIILYFIAVYCLVLTVLWESHRGSDFEFRGCFECGWFHHASDDCWLACAYEMRVQFQPSYVIRPFKFTINLAVICFWSCDLMACRSIYDVFCVNLLRVMLSNSS